MVQDKKKRNNVAISFHKYDSLSYFSVSLYSCKPFLLPSHLHTTLLYNVIFVYKTFHLFFRIFSAPSNHESQSFSSSRFLNSSFI